MRYDHYSLLPERAFQRIGGRMTYEGGGKSAPTPAAPDYSGIASSNAESAALAKSSADADLAFRTRVYDESKPRQIELEKLATDVANQQMGIADKNQGHADEQWNQYKSTYLPNELQTMADAYGSSYLSDDENKQISNIISGKTGMDAGAAQQELGKYGRTAENRAGDKAVTKVNADINSSYGQQMRGLTRMGGDPARLAAAAAALANNQSLAKVGAGNTAREAARGQLLGLRSGAANFGRNMPNTAGQAFGLATQAGSSAVANQNTGFQAGLPYAQLQAGGYGSQIGSAAIGQQGALGLGGLMSRDYATNVGAVNAANAAQGAGLAGLGTAAGTLGAAYLQYGSDRSIKENIVRIGTSAMGIPIYSFEYREPYRDLWGYGEQVGVMADEVELVKPEAVSMHRDGYKMVNYAMLG